MKRPTPPPPVLDAHTRLWVDKVLALYALDANWNGMGAAQPAEKAIEAAKAFVMQGNGRNLPYTDVTAGTQGEVTLKLETEYGLEAEMDFLPNGEATLLVFTDRTDPDFEGPLSWRSLSDALGVIL